MVIRRHFLILQESQKSKKVRKRCNIFDINVSTHGISRRQINLAYSGYLTLIYLFFIQIGSVHLGWHYAVDGYASMILTWLLWRLSGWIVNRYQKKKGFLSQFLRSLSCASSYGIRSDGFFYVQGSFPGAGNSVVVMQQIPPFAVSLSHGQGQASQMLMQGDQSYED